MHSEGTGEITRKEYDLIVIGSGSGMNYVDAMREMNPAMKIAVVDKDEPGGICLTRGCIPSKLLLYPADLVRTIDTAGRFGIEARIESIDFKRVMDRMRSSISGDIETIRRGLTGTPNVDYYRDTAEFVEPYALRVGDVTIASRMIFLCTGSRPAVPPVEGLSGAGYLTSDTVLTMERLPRSIVIIGGGYIAAEYGHFFSAMGSEVTILGRNPKFIPEEEPEISDMAKLLMSAHMKILTNHQVQVVRRDGGGLKKVIARERDSKKDIELSAEEILVATGRISNTDILHPVKGGIKTDKDGWIEVNEFMETSQPGIYAFGDADGKFLFKHVANYESRIVYYNAVLNRKARVDYHAVPHAIFSYPEVAGVGMREAEAIEKLGEDKVLIGFQRYEDTARGLSMEARGCFVKVLVGKGTGRILGAHIIGPHASILIHEIIPLMYTQEQDARAILQGMHIHPALSEVVERAFAAVMEPAHYHHVIGHFFEELGLPAK